jgi:hypothetical protein
MGTRAKVGLALGAVLVVSAAGAGTAVGRTVHRSPTAPSASRWHVEGTHAGTEIIALHTSRCPVLDHSLDETMTVTDPTATGPTTWTYQAQYCGTVDAHGVWRGVGTFVITAGPGSTLSGRLTSSAQLPSVGVPYPLTVDHGTGQFEGARGSCLLDNHLVPAGPGVQHQSGTFVCDGTI